MDQQKRWLLVSAISAVATVSLVGIAFLLPSTFAVGLLLLGAFVFVIVLLKNPAYRYWRLAVVIGSGWLASRALPDIVIRVKWRDDLLSDFWLTQNLGWSFDLTAAVIFLGLLMADFASGEGGTKLLLTLFRIRSRSEGPMSGGDNSQIVRMPEVSGSHNTFNIVQNNGPDLQAVATFIHSNATDPDIEIDRAAEHSKDGKHDVAIQLLTDIQKRRWDHLTPRARYRLLESLGRVWERKGEIETAARLYIESKTHQSNDDKARALEAVGYTLLGDYSKAFSLAEAILKDHPTCALACAITVRCAPDDVSFAELEASVSQLLKGTLEVLHALGCRALKAGDWVAAERLIRSGLLHSPPSPEFVFRTFCQ